MRAESDVCEGKLFASLSFLCVLKSPLLQTVWAAEMVDGVGRGGGRQRTWRQARINCQCNEMAWCQVTMELPSLPVYQCRV